MRIEAPPRLSRPIPLTPLIDVVFLMLMFFMLSTTFAKFGEVDMGGHADAVAEGGAAPAPANSIPGVIVDVGHGPAVKVNGRRLEPGQLVGVLDDFAGRGVATGVIRPRHDADVQDLVTVLQLARTSRLSAIVLAR